MDELWSFAGVIALWIGVSVGLWWLHRRSVHARQQQQTQQAAQAGVHIAEAQRVFDAIRSAPSIAGQAPDADSRLTAETYALLKHLQEHSAFFDKVNVLRVKMLAAFGIEDHPPLSEILHIRRDLWAASEIILVEDPSSFGEAFAEEGAYERFRAEAALLLFKNSDARPGDEDVIDLRLSLARSEAESFAAELKDAIRLARERDRLPTAAEIIAYPIGAARAVPGKLRTARAFLLEFYAYAAEVAGGIRRSEAMARGAGELRRAREELPQRLVTGFERASTAARQSATGLRRHYDFLVAAHDFQVKYEQVLRRAPAITERGRQFIARLELADRSERLRLTSANLLIWLTRRSATALAHILAGVQRLHELLRHTPPGALAAALVAPTPVRGRRLPAFRSYQAALGMSGLREERPRDVPLQQATATAPPKRKAAAKPSADAAQAKQQSKAKKPVAAKPAQAATPAKANASAAKSAATPTKTTAPKNGTLGKSGTVAVAPVAKAPPVQVAAPKLENTRGGKGGKAEPVETTAQLDPAAAKPDVKASRAEPAQPRTATVVSAPAAKPITAPDPVLPAPVAPTQSPAMLPSAPARPPQAEKPRQKPRLFSRRAPQTPPASAHAAEPAATPRKPVAVAEPAIALPAIEEPPAATPRQAGSFFSRLFTRKQQPLQEPEIDASIIERIAEAWEREHAADPTASTPAPTPPETTPTLLAKLSGIPAENSPAEDEDEADEDEDGRSQPVYEEIDDADTGDGPGPLTLSVMEVQAKLAPKPSQIRSFPWLRG